MAKKVTLYLSEESEAKMLALGLVSGENFQQVQEVTIGFSFWGSSFLFRALWKQFFLLSIIPIIVIMLVTMLALISGEEELSEFFLLVIALIKLVSSFYIDRWTIKKFLRMGYVPATDEDRKILEEKGIIKNLGGTIDGERS